MLDRVLAHRYADALLQECDSPKMLEEIAEQLHGLARAFAESDSPLRHVLLNPLFHVEQRLAILQNLRRALGLHARFVRFMVTLVRRDRAGHLPEISKAFAYLRRVREGVLLARVTSATPLSESNREALAALLAGCFAKRVILDCRQDARLLGGIRVHAAGFVFDATLRGRARALRKQLLE